ncbi:MAG: SusD/RagB family nutrient-binding outer membrane lipoprotein [Cyclobacteriaceae bacterium]
MKKIYVIIALLVLNACTNDFDEINTNPNQPERVPANMILTQLIMNLATFTAEHAYDRGNFITQYTARQNFTDFDRYAWTPDDGVWNTLYGRLRDVNNLIVIAHETGNTNYEAIGLIWKSFVFSFLTDVYGEIPYSEAIKGRDGAIYSPVYDSQQSIYQGILADLKRASEIINPSGLPIEGDIMYNNDIEKWRRFANSLRLRYLLRISNVENVSTEMQQIVSNEPIFRNLSDQASLTYLESAPNQWFTHTGRIGSFRERRMSQTIETRFETLNDPRVREYFRPTGAYVNGDWDKMFNGIPNGLGEAEALDYDGGSNFQSELAEKYYDLPNDAEALVMTYFELQFILAEAAYRGFITGNVSEYYTNGVRSAVSYYNIDEERVDQYMAQELVQFNSDNALEQIMLQKWIGSFMIGVEGWNDWRRTGLPEFTPAVSDDNNNRVPVRYLYPQNEQVYNPANRIAAIGRQGSDDINTRIWWMGPQ